MQPKFQIGQTYTAAEVAVATGSRMTFTRTRQHPAGIYAINDTEGDWTQYDFTGTPEALSLVAMDGASVQPSAAPPFIAESVTEVPYPNEQYAGGMFRLADVAFGKDVADESGVSLFAYMWRRFGPAWFGSDEDKELAEWVIYTRLDGLFLVVSPKVGALCHSFAVLYGMAQFDRFPADGRSDNEAVLECRAELVRTMRDLLNPVFVRDVPINALGRMDEESIPVGAIVYDRPCRKPGDISPHRICPQRLGWGNPQLQRVDELGSGSARPLHADCHAPGSQSGQQ